MRCLSPFFFIFCSGSALTHRSYSYLSQSSSVCLSVGLSLCLRACLSLCLSASASALVSVSLHLHLPRSPPISVYLSVSPSVCIFVPLSIANTHTISFVLWNGSNTLELKAVGAFLRKGPMSPEQESEVRDNNSNNICMCTFLKQEAAAFRLCFYFEY